MQSVLALRRREAVERPRWFRARKQGAPIAGHGGRSRAPSQFSTIAGDPEQKAQLAAPYTLVVRG